MELYQANRQWATRPADENYPSIQALYDATKWYRELATEREKVKLDTIRTEAIDGDVRIVGKANIPAKLSNWAFGQVAKFAGAPSDYLRQLPATLAVQNLNHGLAQRAKDTVVNLLFHAEAASQRLVLRALTSDIYSRIWNVEVAERLLQYANMGWQAATPTFRNSGDGKTGLWASDHDMFAFITHPDRVVKEDGNERGLLRGMIAINSEVGAAKIRLLRFLYREMCGNHIIWGAEQVIETSARHVGNVRDQFNFWQGEIIRYMDESASEDEARVKRARSKVIAATKDEVINSLFGLRILPRKALTAGYDAVVEEQDGPANTAWGLAQGLTRYSQTIPYADKRTDIDRAAGKVLALAF